MAMLSAYLADPNIIAAFAVFSLVVLVSIGVYEVISAPRRAGARVEQLVHQLDAMAVKLSDAERIGGFGTFSWDFEHPENSFWSPEMFELCGLVARKDAPSIEALLTTVHEKDR